jgi:diacylglycerol kinase (ATP)
VSYYNEKGIKRFFNAILFSMAGFKAAWANEEAFRQETVIGIMAIALAFWLGESSTDKVLLIGSVVLILFAELINSAIEAVVDRVGTEHHELAGRAKDLGSASVMIMILMAILTWLIILF